MTIGDFDSNIMDFNDYDRPRLPFSPGRASLGQSTDVLLSSYARPAQAQGTNVSSQSPGLNPALMLNVRLPFLLSRGRVSLLVDMFLSRLHPSMPFFKRSYLLSRTRCHQQDHNYGFNTLLHAICALTLLQPLQGQDESVLPDRMQEAERVFAHVIQLHADPDLGEAPTLDTVLTSFFLFACQFCRGKHNAAKLRLGEAVALAETLGLYDDPCSYESLDPGEADNRRRTAVLLTTIERYVLCDMFYA